MFRGLDLTKDKFDPNNAEHVKELNAKIHAFSLSIDAYKKADAIIALPFTATFLLWMANTYGMVLQLVLFGCCAALLWANDCFAAHQQKQSNYQQNLNMLLTIYQKMHEDYGPGIFANENALKLLATIAPYVSTDELWCLNKNSPREYPDGFKKILSTSPHRVPFCQHEASSSHNSSSFRGVLLGRLASRGSAAALPIEQAQFQMSSSGTIGSLATFFSRALADAKQIRYGWTPSSTQRVLPKPK